MLVPCAAMLLRAEVQPILGWPIPEQVTFGMPLQGTGDMRTPGPGGTMCAGQAVPPLCMVRMGG